MNKITPSFFAMLDLNIFGLMFSTLLFWINLHIYIYIYSKNAGDAVEI
jgi:hypothetical protein